MTTSKLLTALRAARDGLTSAPVSGWAGASDPELSELIALAASLRQTVERHAALGAGEVARRSTVEHGFSGFAQRAGHRTVEEFLRVQTGVTGRDAAMSVRVGALATADGARWARHSWRVGSVWRRRMRFMPDWVRRAMECPSSFSSRPPNGCAARQ